MSEQFVLILSLALFLAVLPFVPRIATAGNVSNLLSNFWPLLVIAVGQTFVMILGGIDLSQIAVVAVASVLGAAVMTAGADPTLFEKSVLWGVVMDEGGGVLAGTPFALAGGLAVMLLAGAAIGALLGAVIANFQVPAFMITLVGLLFFSALAVWLTRSENVTNLPEGFGAIADRGAFGVLSWSALIAVAVAAGAHLLLSRTVFGRWVYAVGMNSRAARISGVPVRRVVFWCYVVSGLCAAVGAILYSARLEMGRPAFGDNLNLLLDVIGATVIGGTSLFGGRGKVIWTLYGVVLFVLLSNALNLLNLTYFAVLMVKGGVILLAAWLDVQRRRLLGQT
jgi:ribose/xylose/arabinose/galactoside ABC-type transport system permease subunit